MSHVETMSLNDQEPFENPESQSNHSSHEDASSPDTSGDEQVIHEEALLSAEENLSEDIHSDEESQSVEVHSNEENRSKEEGHSKEKGQKQHYESFLADLEKLPDADAKLHHVVAFMESSLSQHGSPHFKSFWEARNLCLDLFKDNINPALRAEMWAKYTELSKEARRLKEILDEQSAFAAEQIEIAVQALIQDIEKNNDRLSIEAPYLLPQCAALENRSQFYELGQRELNLLNAQASRINALRKELIRTEMRVRQKNKFFQQLSSAGDLVFPRRKELIKDISQNFIDDVESFVKDHFSREEYHESLFYLREEIKILQGIAKFLTLNTHSFTQTRMRLSESWDKIKNAEKERKKERAHQKGIFRQNAQNIQNKIQEFQASFAEGQLSTSAANEEIDEIFALMKSTDLGRDEIKFLREELATARKPLLEKIKADEEARNAADLERERHKKEKILQLRQNVENLLTSAESLDVEELVSQRDVLLQEIVQAQMTKMEKQEIERSLKPLKDMITEKKEKALLNLSDDDRQALNQLKELLKQRKERRQDIKNQIESYRKASGSSGFDFEKALAFNAQMAEEKDRLERLNEGIKEIEQKVAELESKS